MDAKEWVQRGDLQKIINKWAFGHYITGKDEQDYQLLIEYSKDYQEWYMNNKKQPTLRGYETSYRGYRLTLVDNLGTPIYLEVEQEGVKFRINFYHTSKQYTVEMVDVSEYQTWRGRIGQLIGV